MASISHHLFTPRPHQEKMLRPTNSNEVEELSKIFSKECSIPPISTKTLSRAHEICGFAKSFFLNSKSRLPKSPPIDFSVDSMKTDKATPEGEISPSSEGYYSPPTQGRKRGSDDSHMERRIKAAFLTTLPSTFPSVLSEVSFLPTDQSPLLTHE